MRDAVKAVVGAVAKKDIVPVLTHIHIAPGFVQGGDGAISITVPCETPVAEAINVPGHKLAKALEAAENRELRWEFEPDRLQLRAGRLRVWFPLLAASYPEQPPLDAGHTEVDGDALVAALAALRPCVALDGTRPWACGVRLAGGAAYATNNIVLARYRTAALPDVVPTTLPVTAVDELMRLSGVLDTTPNRMQITDYAAVFTWPCGTTLRTNLIEHDWPDTIDEMVDGAREAAGSWINGELLSDLRQAVTSVIPFSQDERAPTVHLDGEGVRTAEGGMRALLEVEGLPDGNYRAEVLDLVLGMATEVGLDTWPQACPFRGGRIDGVFVGMR